MLLFLAGSLSLTLETVLLICSQGGFSLICWWVIFSVSFYCAVDYVDCHLGQVLSVLSTKRTFVSMVGIFEFGNLLSAGQEITLKNYHDAF